MKHIFKIIFKILFVLVFAISCVIFIITVYFSDEIKMSVVKKIQQNIEAPLILDNVDLTIYDNFPYTSLKISNLTIIESERFDEDTLLFAKRAYIELSLIDILKKVYDLKSIIITDAKINIKYNNLNNPNFKIFKNNNQRNAEFSIKKITLLNTEFNIKKEIPILDMRWALDRAIITINEHEYSFNTKGYSNNLIVGMTDYMKSKKFHLITKTQIKKDTITIHQSDLNLENVLLKTEGTILYGNTLNLKVSCKNQEIHQIIKNLPKNIQKGCAPFTANGKISFNSSLKGLINKENNPLFKMDYEILEGKFKLKTNAFTLYDIHTSGSLSNGENKNFYSTKIVSNIFNASTKNGTIRGEFTLKNLNDYFLITEFKSSWDLRQINRYVKKSPFSKLKGRLRTNTNFKGNISFNNRFKKMFLNSKHKSDIKLEDVFFNYKQLPLSFNLQSVSGTLDKHKIIINSCVATMSETDLNFEGEILNLIPYILNEAPKIYVDGSISSTYTNFSEFMSISKNSNKKNLNRSNLMPNWIDAKSNINIKTFSYEKFVASDLIGDVSYKNGKLTIGSLNTLSLSGEITGEAELTEPTNNTLRLLTNLKLKKINIRNSFDAFNNYGQNFISKKHLKGVGTAEVEIESYWKPKFILDTKKLKINSHLIIEKGELIEFQPLESLSSYVSLDELKHVRFSTLENTINVSDEIITIPTMEIKSSALSMFLSGTHTFSQKINYEITLLLSEILSTSFRKRNTKITEFGEEKKDGKIFNTVYLKMNGNTKDPKFSLNKIRFMEDINNSVKKEREIINNIIKEDILQTKEKEEEEEGQDIEIKWNPEL